jgi:hypothetical protein
MGHWLEELSTMRMKLLSGLVLGLALTGCVKDPPPAPEPQRVSPDQALRELRAELQSADPRSRVGLVISVLHEERLVAVGDIPVQDFREGDVITFVDQDGAPFVNGRVVRITDDALHVKYESNGRPPERGDIAVNVIKR